MRMMKKVAIIEDEPDVAQTMKMLVEREGYSVDYFLDPRKGIDALKRSKYDILLLDIMMPAMSGREVLEKLDKLKVSIPVLLVSAIGLPHEISRELSIEHPNVKGIVPKTKMHLELCNEIGRIIGK